MGDNTEALAYLQAGGVGACRGKKCKSPRRGEL